MTDDDAGKYSCIASNKNGDNVTSARLKVYSGFKPSVSMPPTVMPQMKGRKIIHPNLMNTMAMNRMKKKVHVLLFHLHTHNLIFFFVFYYFTHSLCVYIIHNDTLELCNTITLFIHFIHSLFIYSSHSKRFFSFFVFNFYLHSLLSAEHFIFARKNGN